MESLKLKVENRTILYYNQYKYRVMISISNQQGFPSPWQHQSKTEMNVLTLIRDFAAENVQGNKIRHTYSGVSFYSNDLDAVNKFHALGPKKSTQIFEAELAPAGVKLFKKDPPAKYRAYLKDKRIESSVKDELCTFFVNNTGLKPNGPLHSFIHPNNTYRFNYAWIHAGQYFDYDDPAALTYISLLFPGIVGKTYKLEKKQD